MTFLDNTFFYFQSFSRSKKYQKMRVSYLNTPTTRFSKRKPDNSKRVSNSVTPEKLDRKKAIAKSRIENKRIIKTEHLLQLTTLLILSAFGVLLFPNIVANDSTKVSASEPTKVELLAQTQHTSSLKSSNSPALIEAGLDQGGNVKTATTTSSSSKATELSKIYVVNAGENLNEIAQKLNIDPVELALANNLKTIRVSSGTELKLP